MRKKKKKKLHWNPFNWKGNDATLCQKKKEKKVKSGSEGFFSVPTVVLYHVGQLDDVFALLVLLAQLESLFIFPAQRGVTVFTVDVGHGVKSCEQQPLLCGTTTHVDHRVEEVRSALAALKRLGDQIIVVGQVSTAVNAAVAAVAGVQVGLERLGLRQLHHD